MPVSLDDERFEGKVVIVTLNGTWCPNCNDEARFMAPFHQQYREENHAPETTEAEQADLLAQLPDMVSNRVGRLKKRLLNLWKRDSED